MASPMLSPQVVSAQQNMSPSESEEPWGGLFTLNLLINSLTILGGCQPCVGKQNPIRSPT